MVRGVVIAIMLSFSIVLACFGQDQSIAKIEQSLPFIKDSFQLVDAFNRLSILLYEKNIDSTFYYADKARQLAVRLNYKRGIADATNNFGIFYDIKGEAEFSLRYYNAANSIYKEINDSSNVVQTWMNIAVVYDLIGKKEKGLDYFKEAFLLGSKLVNDSIMSLVYSNYVLLHSNNTSKDTIDIYLDKAFGIAKKYYDLRVALQVQQLVANRLIEGGNRDSGLHLLQQTVAKALSLNFNFLSLDMLLTLGDNYIDSLPGEAVGYYQQALAITRNKNYGSYSKIILKRLHDFYLKNKRLDSAYVYSEQMLEVYDEQQRLNNESGIDYIQYALKEQELESITQIAASNTKISILAIIVGLMAVIVALVLWRSKAKALETNKLLQLQFQQLESTTQLLEAGNENYARVLKVVAHDLRNPIANIFLLSRMVMDDDEVKGQSLEFTRLVHQISNTCISQIGDLMSADLGIGEESVQRTRVAIASLLSEVIMLMNYKAKEKKQELILQATDGPIIFADPEKITRVINNLLVNAIKFSPNDAVIVISLATKDDAIIISIKDAGIGIPKSLAATLFDPFTKARRRGTAGEETFGLGLFISKKIIEAHYGSIWFESEEGSGTTFYIKLPIGDHHLSGKLP